ncbi:hypothetical protein CASFOL_036358 [Castilleja foliolosa]|uniref:Uncharacterized protein n=1 Tax=Castilleja foliolosa TaxID=1961234 RepID=A0ABD3BWX9_9LAMI
MLCVAFDAETQIMTNFDPLQNICDSSLLHRCCNCGHFRRSTRR